MEDSTTLKTTYLHIIDNISFRSMVNDSGNPGEQKFSNDGKNNSSVILAIEKATYNGMTIRWKQKMSHIIVFQVKYDTTTK